VQQPAEFEVEFFAGNTVVKIPACVQLSTLVGKNKKFCRINYGNENKDKNN
jgi:hypothetical protein